MRTTDEILKDLLLPNDSNWDITSVTCDDKTEEIRVKVSYVSKDVELDGVHYPIYDHRPEREWRHLDLWQYKTFIVASVPRYMKDGKVISVNVPWAKADARLSWLLEKKR